MEFLLNKHLRKTIGIMSFIRYIIPIFILLFTSGLSAQTVSLVPEQCGQTIQYGDPIFCTENDSATEYEFKFFTRRDTVVINSTRNYLLVDEYRNRIRTHVNFNVLVRCKFRNNWGQYGDTCSSLIYLDGFEEMLAKFGRPEEPTVTLRSGEPDNDEEYEIPVVFHVFVPMSYHGSNLADYLPPEKIYESLQILNDVFSGKTANPEDGDRVDTRIRFCIAKENSLGNEIKVDYNGEEYFGITYLKTDMSANINASGLTPPSSMGYPIYDPRFNYYGKFPRNKYLNIFVFEHLDDGAAGKAWSDYFGQNGIGYVSLAKQFIGTNNSPDRSLGYSLPHEVGHFLGLYHTWHNSSEGLTDEELSFHDCNCEERNGCITDYVDDTPCHLSPSTYCGVDNNQEPFNNIMNYTPDGCRRVFTKGQKVRMRQVIDCSYSDLVNNDVECICTLPHSSLATRILSPTQHFACLGTHPIVIEFSDITLFRKVEIYKDSQIQNTYTYNNIPAEYINNNTISIPNAISTEGFYRINVYSGTNTDENTWNMITHSMRVTQCSAFDGNYNQAQWYFDRYASLDFRSGIAQLQEGSGMDAGMSESSICDDAGNLLFYTDGLRIWDNQHHELNLTYSPNENISSKGTIILKFSSTKYVVFSTTETGSLTYRIITVNVNNNISVSNIGDLETIIFNPNEFDGLSSLAAVPAIEDGKYWLLSATTGTTAKPVVMKVGITNNGISEEINPTNIQIPNIPIQCGDNSPYVNSINVSPTSEYVVYCGQGESKLLRFNAVTGELVARNCQFDAEKKSDAAFSPSGRFLYMSSLGSQWIDQYDLSNVSECGCPHNPVTIFRPTEGILGDYNIDEYVQEFGPLPTRIGNYIQEGPDGRIYFSNVSDSREMSRTIGVIRNPEAQASSVNNNACDITYPFIRYESSSPYYNCENLPNFVDAVNMDTCKVNFTICSNDCANIKIENMSLGKTRYQWTFKHVDNASNIYTCYGYNPTDEQIATLTNNLINNNINRFIVRLDKLDAPDCENAFMEKTVSFSPPQISITEPSSICNDGNAAVFGITPADSLVSVSWSCSIGQSSTGLEYSLGYNGAVPENNVFSVTATATNIYGCTATVNKQVNINSIGYSATVSNHYCAYGQQASGYITVNSNGVYNFADNSRTLSNINYNNVYFDLLDPGYYTFEISNDDCHYRDSVEITYIYDDPRINVSKECNSYPLTYTITISNATDATATIPFMQNCIWESDNDGVITILVSNYMSENPQFQSPLVYLPTLGTEEAELSITVTDNVSGCENVLNAEMPITPYVEFLDVDCEDSYSATFIIYNVTNSNLLNIISQNLTVNQIGTSYMDSEGLVYRVTASSCDELNNTILSIRYNGCLIYEGSAGGADPLVFESINLKDVEAACLSSKFSYPLPVNITGGIPPYSITVLSGGHTQHFVLNQPGENIINIDVYPSGTTSSEISINVTSFDGQQYTFYADMATLDNNAVSTVLNDLIGSNSYFNNTTYYVAPQTNANDAMIFDHDVTFTNCTIYCAYTDYNDIDNTQWTVEPGYTITFENCTIKSGCPDRMWKGIVIEGNNSATQSTSTHGMVDIKQSSVIADAMVALKSVDGGIIKANNSEFRNNQCDLYFDEYRNKHTQTVVRGNTFITLDGGLNDHTIHPQNHIHMNTVNGIAIKSNTFRNENFDVDISKWGTGIYSYSSGYVVSPRVLSGSNGEVPVEPKNFFENLYYGVKASGKGTTAPSIKHNVFTGNFRGVYINSADASRVLYNNFTGIYDRIYIQPLSVVYSRAINIPSILPYLERYDKPYSVYFNNSESVYCEENNIVRCEVGAYINNSGDGISRMYRNNFGRQPEGDRSTDMEGGTMVLRINSDSDLAAQPGKTGLQVRCNGYTATGSAIDVSGNMRLNQGTNDDRKVEPAGNQFHTSLANGMEFNAPNTSEDYNYYQTLNNTANTGFHTELVDNRCSGVEAHNIYIEVSNLCRSNYGLHIIYNDHILRIDTVKLVVGRLKFTYDSIVDRGNTNMMLAQIASVSLFNMSGPLNTLSNGGYLSDTVFSALLASNAPAAFKSAVLVANSPLPRKIRTMVENSNLSSTYKQIIAALQIGTSARERLQYKIDGGYQEIAMLESEIFHEAVNNDTVTAVRDTAIGYFHGKIDYTYKDLIYVYKLQLSKQDYSSARGTLKDIYGMTTGMELDLRYKVTTFCSVNEIYVDFLTAASEAQAIKVLEDNSTTLLTAIDDEYPLYSGLAEILYEHLADGEFLEYTPSPEVSISSKSVNIVEYPDISPFIPKLSAYPNPTSDIVFIEYNFEYSDEEGVECLLDALGKLRMDNCERGILNIYSSDSKLLYSKRITQKHGLENISLHDYPSGLFLIEIIDCNNNSNSIKITKE